MSESLTALVSRARVALDSLERVSTAPPQAVARAVSEVQDALEEAMLLYIEHGEMEDRLKESEEVRRNESGRLYWVESGEELISN